MKHSVFIAALLALTLGACGQENNETTTNVGPDEMTPVEPAPPVAEAPEATETPAATSDAMAEAPIVDAEAPAAMAQTPDAAAEPPDAMAEAPDSAAETLDAVAETPDAAEPPDAMAESVDAEAMAAAPADAAPPAADAAAPAAMDVEAGSALAKKSGCFACHHLEQKRVGPSWKDVGEKYKDDPTAKESVVQWIKVGGTGRWNMGVMPAYSPRVSDENINALADFVLSLRK